MAPSLKLSPGPRQGVRAPQVNDSLCRTCGRCQAAAACRGHAFIRFGRDEAPYIDAGQCRACLACRPACPFNAIEVSP